jgi:hypothetical protein
MLLGSFLCFYQYRIWRHEYRNMLHDSRRDRGLNTIVVVKGTWRLLALGWLEMIYDMMGYIISYTIYNIIWYNTKYDVIWHDMIYYMLWYDIWYDVIWYDMTYIIWYGMMWYDMIYLPAVGLTPVGNITVQIYTKQYTEYKERNIQNNKKVDIHNNKKLTNLGSASRARSLPVIPWHLLYDWRKSTVKPELW